MKYAELEQLAVDLGLERKKRQQRQARETSTVSTTGPGRYLLRQSIRHLAKAIHAQRKLLRAGPMKGAVSLQNPLNDIANNRLVEVAAFLTLRLMIDRVYEPSPQIALAVKIADRIEDELRFRQFKRQDTGSWAFLRRKHVASGYVHFRRVVFEVAKHEGIEIPRFWTRKERVAFGQVLIRLVCEHTGLFEEYRQQGAKKHAEYIVQATDKTVDWVERSFDEQVLRPFWLPAGIPPRPWKTLTDGGYVNEQLGYCLVKLYPWLNKAKATDYEPKKFSEVLSSVNVLQAIAWQINRDVWETAEHLWEVGSEAAQLPRREDEPLPSKPLDIDENEEVRRKWRDEVRKTRDRNAQVKSHRIQAVKTFYLARKFRDQERFFMPHILCFRSRAYCLPTFLDYQGPSLSRGLLRFAESKPLKTDEDERWYLIGGANRFGFDKGTYDERAAWTESKHALIKAVYRDPLECRWWEEADSPWEFLAWCLEAGELLERGREGFTTQLPVDTDGACNGLQIFGLLLRDRSTCEATGVLPSERPRDIYSDIAKEVDKYLAKDAAKGEEYAERWLEFCPDGIPRGACKRPVMTKPYGATPHSAGDYTAEWFREERARRGLKVTNMEGDGFKECLYLSRLIWKAINKVVVAAQECMDYLQGVVKVMVREKKRMVWTTPLGWPVFQAYTKQKAARVASVVGDVVRWHQYREATHQTDLKSNVQAVSANYVHSLDAACLHRIVNLAFARGIREIKTIHDSFGVLAPDMPVLGRTIREVFAEVFEQDLLAKFHREMQAIVGPDVELPELPERGDVDPACVLGSPYFFN